MHACECVVHKLICVHAEVRAGCWLSSSYFVATLRQNLPLNQKIHHFGQSG